MLSTWTSALFGTFIRVLMNLLPRMNVWNKLTGRTNEHEACNCQRGQTQHFRALPRYFVN